MKKRSLSRQALMEQFKDEILSRLKESFPEQRFIVRLSPQYRDFVDVTWTEGPTKIEVESDLKFVTWRDEYRTENMDVTCQRIS